MPVNVQNRHWRSNALISTRFVHSWKIAIAAGDIRNLAFLGIAYNTLLRIAEIARIRVKDISRTDGGRMLIHIGRTKTLVSTAGVEGT